MSMIWTLDDIENKHDECKGSDCMEKFCESLIEYAMKIINFDKKIIP